MTLIRLAMRPVLIAIACGAIVGCADSPSRQSDMDYRSEPTPTMRDANSTSGSSGQRLIIQSGEGERLNLPWFIQDTQDWVNSN